MLTEDQLEYLMTSDKRGVEGESTFSKAGTEGYWNCSRWWRTETWIFLSIYSTDALVCSLVSCSSNSLNKFPLLLLLLMKLLRKFCPEFGGIVFHEFVPVID